MYKPALLTVLNLIYIGLLSLFIFFYILALQPIKIKNQCAENSAKATMNLARPFRVDPYDYYHNLYNFCLSKNGGFLQKLRIALAP